MERSGSIKGGSWFDSALENAKIYTQRPVWSAFVRDRAFRLADGSGVGVVVACSNCLESTSSKSLTPEANRPAIFLAVVCHEFNASGSGTSWFGWSHRLGGGLFVRGRRVQHQVLDEELHHAVAVDRRVAAG